MGDRIGVQLQLRGIYLSLTNHPGQLSLAIPSWVGAMSTGQRAVMLCDWGVKADMVLFAGNTVWSISEHVRGVCMDALYKSTFTLLYFMGHPVLITVMIVIVSPFSCLASIITTSCCSNIHVVLWSYDKQWTTGWHRINRTKTCCEQFG